MTAPEQPAPKLRRLQVVTFTAADPILGGRYSGLGVVTAVDGDVVTVRPVADHAVQVAAADVTPTSADDLVAG